MSKKHFRSINGCSLSTFEGHLAEMMWRNHDSCNSANEYEELFALLKQYYPLDESCKLGNCANLFETWNADSGKISQHYEDAAPVNNAADDAESAALSDKEVTIFLHPLILA